MSTSSTTMAGCRTDPDCDDADPCTDDRCVSGRCESVPLGGVAAVVCALPAGATMPSACAAVQIPAPVAQGIARAGDLLARAGAPGRRNARRVLAQQAAAQLGHALRGWEHARVAGPVPAACGAQLSDALRVARARALEWKAGLATPVSGAAARARGAGRWR